MNKIIYLLLFICLGWVASCNKSDKNNTEKLKFNIFFDKLRDSPLMSKYNGVKYFGPLRGDYLIFGDSLYFGFNADIKKYTYDSSSIKVPKENKKTNYHQLINYFLVECKKYNIIAFEFSDSSSVKYFFDLKLFDPTTLPYYEIQHFDNNETYDIGVLMYDSNHFETTSFFNYLKPVKVTENWYYYITYFKEKYD